ncbi:MAG TPA: DUF5672 family protein [Thermodesulfobacteriota bacterium]
MSNGSAVGNHQPSRLVAVVVPLSDRKELTTEEGISFRHLMRFLGKYDKYLVVPKSLQVDNPDFGIKRFDERFFGSPAAHAKLMLSPKFYGAFTEYKYILLYHLDSLVFSDQLIDWCETDLDYIGPPWLNCPDSPWVKVPRVGNSGFSLMKIESFLKVIYSPGYRVEPAKYWEDFCASNPRYIQYLNLPRKYLKRLKIFNGIRWEIFRWLKAERNSDIFWSDEAVKYYPEFKIASFETGLRFAFEVAPRLCFELNNHKLPFGCHAWYRYDRDFWGPYLLK